MSGSSSLFIGGLCFALGEERPVSELRTEGNKHDIATLLANGLLNYRASEDTVAELSGRALISTLAAWGGDPSEIDLLIYCSESLGHAEEAELGRFCSDCGLGDVPIVGLTLSVCSALAPAIRYARALLEFEGLRHVAVIIAEKCSAQQSRIANWGTTVFSDCAASCIVSSRRAGAQFQIRGLAHSASQVLRAASGAEGRARLLKTYGDGVRNTVALCLAEAGLPAGQADHMILTSSRLDAMRFNARICGIDPDRVFTETLSSMAHTYSADAIISLASSGPWRDRMNAGAGNPTLVLMLGPHTWGAMLADSVRN